MRESLKFYIMYYKSGKIFSLDEHYQPLFCGQFPEKEKLAYPKDDTGIHISTKNKYYSELTGIYWVWKNTKQDVVGICHYRRFYTLSPDPWYLKVKYFVTHPFKVQKGPVPLIHTNNIDKYLPKVLSEYDARELLKNFDIILPTARRFRYSVKYHYEKYHSPSDLEVIEDILLVKCPAYLSTWREMLLGNVLYANNMFVLRNERFQEFMEWWFSILEEFESRVNLSTYTGYQERIVGFIAERLLTLWVIHHELKIKELKLIYFKRMKNVF